MPIELGQTIAGVTSPGAKTHAFSFEALAGMAIKVKMKGGTLGPMTRVRLEHPPSGTSVSWNDPTSTMKATLQSSGEYRLVVSGDSFQFGSYKLGTGRKLPKGAKSTKLPFDAKPEHHVVFGALAGATANLVITPKWKKSDYDVALVGPDGEPIGLEAGSMNGKGAFKVKKLPLIDTGEYRLSLSGFQSSKEKVTVKVDLAQPKGKGKVTWWSGGE